MGKRKSKASKKQCLETSTSSSDLHDACDRTSLDFYEKLHLSCESPLLLHEIKESITDIYKEYIIDLKTRKQKRLSQKSPTSETQLYNLVINTKFRTSLKAKIHSLHYSNYTCALRNIIEDVLDTFIDTLKLFLKENEDKSRLLQLVYLYEVYHTMKNSISEIAKIVSELYDYDSFSLLSLKGFYIRVLMSNKKILKFAKTQECSHYAVGSVLSMFEELEDLVRTGEYKVREAESSDLEEISEEPVHSLPLEDLVNYINGSSMKCKRRNRVKRTEYSLKMDDEVNEFEDLLARAVPSINKRAPHCSPDFLKSLTDRYLEIREKILNN